MNRAKKHGHKKAILYVRVSTDDQVRGYSLNQQLETLKEYAEREGYDILEEVRDEGWSATYLERPGLDRVRDLVEEGDVAVVLAQDADRITRDPGHRAFLDEEFERAGSRLVALDDWGDDSHEGQLLKFLKGWVAKGERLKIAERSRRGMLRKAREAGICSRPPYGFRVSNSKDRLVVCEPELAVAGKIFRLAVEGFGLEAIQTRLYREGVSSPTGKPVWDVQMIKRIVENDAYKPHTSEEISELVSPEVGGMLDPDKRYGIHWYNRQKTTTRTVSEPDGKGGKRYRKTRTFRWRPREEWIVIPIELTEHIPRNLVDQARATFAARGGYQRKYLSREWELRGLMRCSCGSKIGTRDTPDNKGSVYHYYICRRRGAAKKAYGCTQKCMRAEPAEAAIWNFVSGLLKDPDRIRAGIEKLIEQERDFGHENSEQEVELWTRQVAECARLRRAYQDQQAAGCMTLEELEEKLKELEDKRRIAEAGLETVRIREQREEELEADRDALLEYMAETVPEGLESLTGEERNEVYRMLKLEITPEPEGYEVQGVLCTSEAMGAPLRPYKRQIF